MSLDSLPAPPSINPASRKLFPVTDDNRHRERAALSSNAPFSVQSSRAILQDMIDAGDSCDNTQITSIQHFQREVAPLHEFLVIRYEVKTDGGPRVANYLVIERWGSDILPEDPSKKKVDILEFKTDLVAQENETETTPEVTTGGGLMGTARATIQLSLELSGKLTTSLASDRILVSYRRTDIDIDKMEPGKRTLIATLTPLPENAISVARLLCVASFVSDHSPVYDLFDKYCFYYSRAIFNIARALMKCDNEKVLFVTQGFEFFRIDALRWTATLFKGEMAKQVELDFGPAAVLEKCDAAWEEFSASVSKQNQTLRQPLENAEQGRREAERRMAEAELEIVRLKALLAASI
ncbi:hypothetical protein DFH08DRAFT_970670 [Mycena albidolilacea]|uniref:Uncharacterized protein n=1 Tax=Mycena albidolilacea TaxID=1033008 RepID=A0AAD6ZEY7_9AGAR|nr:hypothetical protein DFH08DRAFT_970670 [Mycena albidolilacea]